MRSLSLLTLISVLMLVQVIQPGHCLIKTKEQLRLEVVEMINHAFDNYMNNAYPADELMPLTCKGRVRGRTPSRGDIDDSLGNFALTLIDSLDTLAVIGDVNRFEMAVGKVIADVRFDSNLVVSVFETNIRVLGGLIGGHVMSKLMKEKEVGMMSYKDELLYMAIDLADRLLPAFNTTTGVPHSRVNLKYGFHHPKAFVKDDGTTCTACAGTFLLEFAALSRLMGDSTYERKARIAMDYIWSKRSLTSDLVGTILNIKTGEWIRKTSGLGAGIDSYYEYIFKAYVMLGDYKFLHRFNKHYKAIKKYIHEGPLLVNVNMQKPELVTRSHVDALSAFWPAIQVMKGDIKSAIEVHEVFYQVVQLHKFLPEAFNSEFKGVWNHHPIRPEFVESTYFLYRATKDDHYREVAEYMISAIQNYTRVSCGFAAISNIKTGTKEDRFDSFVIAETFKYLYLIFTDDDQLWFNIDDFIFTTEAHLLPYNFNQPYLTNNHSAAATTSKTHFTSGSGLNEPPLPHFDDHVLIDDGFPLISEDTCHNYNLINKPFFASEVRERYFGFVKKDSTTGVSNKPNMCVQINSQTNPPSVFPTINLVSGTRTDTIDGVWKRNTETNSWFFVDSSTKQKLNILKSDQNVATPPDFVPISAAEFDYTNKKHREILALMGIDVLNLPNKNQMQLQHISFKALNPTLAQLGLDFISEIIKINQNANLAPKSATIQILSAPFFGSIGFMVGASLFGYDLSTEPEISNYVVVSRPFDACSLDPGHFVLDFIVVAVRGGCLFAEKARVVQSAGAVGLIVVDNIEDTSIYTHDLFSLSSDGKPEPITIPVVFAFYKEGMALMAMLLDKEPLYVQMGTSLTPYDDLIEKYELEQEFSDFEPVSKLHNYVETAFGDNFKLDDLLLKIEETFFTTQYEPEQPMAAASSTQTAEQGFLVEDVIDEEKEVEDLNPNLFAVIKMALIKHIIQMPPKQQHHSESEGDNGEDISDDDSLNNEPHDDDVAAVFYNQVPTKGIKVAWFTQSGATSIELLLMNDINGSQKETIENLRKQRFERIQIDRMSNGAVRLTGVKTVSMKVSQSDGERDILTANSENSLEEKFSIRSDAVLNYQSNKELNDLTSQVVESSFIDLFTSEITTI